MNYKFKVPCQTESLLNSFLFLSTFSVFLKSLNNYFFWWFAYKSLRSRFSVLINYTIQSSNHFSHPAVSWSRFSMVQVFQGPGFSGSRFLGSKFSGSRFYRVRVFQDPGFSGSRFFRVRVQGQGPGFRSSHAVGIDRKAFVKCSECSVSYDLSKKETVFINTISKSNSFIFIDFFIFIWNLHYITNHIS